jgi:hypothetical protein
MVTLIPASEFSLSPFKAEVDTVNFSPRGGVDYVNDNDSPAEAQTSAVTIKEARTRVVMRFVVPAGARSVLLMTTEAPRAARQFGLTLNARGPNHENIPLTGGDAMSHYAGPGVFATRVDEPTPGARGTSRSSNRMGTIRRARSASPECAARSS